MGCPVMLTQLPVLCVSASVCVLVSRCRMGYKDLLNIYRMRGVNVTIATTPADPEYK